MPEPPEEMRDLIVVLPGIMGSTLARDDNLVWAPSAGAVVTAILTFGRSVRQLTLPDGIGDDHPGDGVEPVEVMPDLHVLPGVWSANIGYGVLLDWLRSTFHLIDAKPDDPERIPNLLAAPYDWRLSNRYNGRRLKRIVEPALERWRSQGGPFVDAKLIFICHSMGGLVARWYIEKEGGAGITRKLITLGTPYRGALSALDQLVNGVRKGIGPLKFDLTAFARSLPSVHQLLPEYACIESPRGLLKTTESTALELDAAIVTDGMRFHDELEDAAAARPAGSYDLHPIAGIRQTTYTTARIVRGTMEPIETIDGVDEAGDATVPRLAAIPKATRPDSPIIRRIADQHGSLQSNKAVLDELEGILAARPVIHRGPPDIELGVRTDPLVLAGENLTIEATVSDRKRIALQAKVIDERGKEVVTTALGPSKEAYRATLEPLRPGVYRVVVGGIGATATRVAPVTCTVLVWDPKAT
jgi:pimeloyl-ACP methyl ester carboxylesterase